MGLKLVQQLRTAVAKNPDIEGILGKSIQIEEKRQQLQMYLGTILSKEYQTIWYYYL